MARGSATEDLHIRAPDRVPPRRISLSVGTDLPVSGFEPGAEDAGTCEDGDFLDFE